MESGKSHNRNAFDLFESSPCKGSPTLTPVKQNTIKSYVDSNLSSDPFKTISAKPAKINSGLFKFFQPVKQGGHDPFEHCTRPPRLFDKLEDVSKKGNIVSDLPTSNQEFDDDVLDFSLSECSDTDETVHSHHTKCDLAVGTSLNNSSTSTINHSQCHLNVSIAADFSGDDAPTDATVHQEGDNSTCDSDALLSEVISVWEDDSHIVDDVTNDNCQSDGDVSFLEAAEMEERQYHQLTQQALQTSLNEIMWRSRRAEKQWRRVDQQYNRKFKKPRQSRQPRRSQQRQEKITNSTTSNNYSLSNYLVSRTQNQANVSKSSQIVTQLDSDRSHSKLPQLAGSSCTKISEESDDDDITVVWQSGSEQS